MRAMHREMTLIEWVSLHDFGMDNYAFWAKRTFCKPSKRTLAKAQKVLKKLDASWDEMMERDLGEWVDIISISNQTIIGKTA